MFIIGIKHAWNNNASQRYTRVCRMTTRGRTTGFLYLRPLPCAGDDAHLRRVLLRRFLKNSCRRHCAVSFLRCAAGAAAQFAAHLPTSAHVCIMTCQSRVAAPIVRTGDRTVKRVGMIGPSCKMRGHEASEAIYVKSCRVNLWF